VAGAAKLRKNIEQVLHRAARPCSCRHAFGRSELGSLPRTFHGCDSKVLMLALSDVRSIDALIADDPDALEDGELKANLHAYKAARARLDAAEAATLLEFDQRCLFVSDGAVNTASWVAHHTGVARAIAGARLALGKHLRRMPLMAEALAAGRVTAGHVITLGRRLSPRTQAAYERDEAMLVEHAASLEGNDFERGLVPGQSRDRAVKEQ
jgi:hypothetical protein